MKKVLSIFVAMLSIFMLVSCKEDKTTTLSPDFVIDIPSNLQIEGTVLSWNPVDQATGYYVYVNHELNTRVTSTTFDFSTLTEDVLIFQVQADAPLGFEDSIPSLSIAYMKYADTEKTILTDMLDNMHIPDGFVDALIYKGMTSDNMATLLSGILSLESILNGGTSSLLDISTELQSYIALDINYEAMFYALITVMPEMLQEEIDFYHARLLEMDDCDMFISSTDCDAQIELITVYINGLSETLSVIEQNPDAILYSLLDSLSYLFSIAGILDPTLVAQIQTMIESDSSATLNTNELLIVKGEIVNTLLENIPSNEDLALLIQVFGAFFSAYGMPLPSYEIAFEEANQITVLIETFAGILDSIDEEFMTDISSIVETYPDSYPPEVIIYLIEHFHDYFQDHQGIVMEWNTFFSDAKKEEIFTTIFSILSTNLNIDLNISYEMMDVLIQSLSDQSDHIYEWFTSTNGEIIRLYYQLDQLSISGNEYEQTVINARINYEWLLLASQLLPTIDDTMISMLKIAFASIPKETIFRDLTEESYQILLVEINNVIDEEIPLFIDFISENVQETIDKEFYDLYLGELEQFNQYVITTYGEDYQMNQSYYEDPVVIYFDTYILEKWITLVISSTDQSFLEDYINNLVLALSTSSIEEITGIYEEDLAYMAQMLMLPLQVRMNAAAEISGFDLYHLTEEQIALFESLSNYMN